MKSKIQINSELAELIGAFIGDGFIGRYGKNPSYHVEFCGNVIYDKWYLEYLSKIITKYFDVKPRFKFYRGAFRMLITYKEIHKFFRDLGFPNGIKNKSVKIPDFLYKSKSVNQIIRGLFDTDGFIFIDKRKIYKKPYARIGFCTKSKKLFLQVKNLFLKRGYKIYTRIDKRSDIHHLDIYGNSQIKTWLYEFGFSNKYKKNYAPLAQLVGVNSQ